MRVRKGNGHYRQKRRLHRKEISWLRDGRSGSRLNRLDTPAEILNEDVIMFDVQAVNQSLYNSSCIDNQSFVDENDYESYAPSDNNTSTNNADEDCTTTSCFLVLPTEIIEHIINFLDIKSVESLSLADQRLERIVRSNYHLHLMLPCRSELLQQLILSRKKILRLTCNCSLRILVGSESGDLRFLKLNLSALKFLQFRGLNYEYEYYPVRLSLPYFNCLDRILSSVLPHCLLRLEILTDTSDRIAKIVVPLLKKFTSLKTLVLYGRTEQQDDPSHIRSNDQAIACLVEASHAQSIRLHRFEQLEENEVRFSAPWITDLYTDLGKFSNLRLEMMTNLRRLTVTENFQCTCLVHFCKGQVLKDLSAGAPNLRYYNEVDLDIIKEMEDNSTARKNWFTCTLLTREQQFHDLSWELYFRKETGELYKWKLFPGYDFNSKMGMDLMIKL